jgi:hypothetical protein
VHELQVEPGDMMVDGDESAIVRGRSFFRDAQFFNHKAPAGAALDCERDLVNVNASAQALWLQRWQIR